MRTCLALGLGVLAVLLCGCNSLSTSCTVTRGYAVVAVDVADGLSDETITTEQLHLRIAHHKPIIRTYHRVIAASANETIKVALFPSGQAYGCFVRMHTN